MTYERFVLLPAWQFFLVVALGVMALLLFLFATSCAIGAWLRSRQPPTVEEALIRASRSFQRARSVTGGER